MTWEIVLSELEEKIHQDFGPNPEVFDDSESAWVWENYQDLLQILNHKGVI